VLLIEHIGQNLDGHMLFTPYMPDTDP